MSRPRTPVLITDCVPLQHRHVEPLPLRRRRRPKVAPFTRLAVFERDGWRCVRCGAERDLTIDHVKPLCKGGANRQANMQTLCRHCNQEKGGS